MLVGDAQGNSVIANSGSNAISAKISGVDGGTVTWVAGSSTINFYQDSTGATKAILSGDLRVNITAAKDVPEQEEEQEGDTTQDIKTDTQTATETPQALDLSLMNFEGHTDDITTDGQVMIDGVFHNANSSILSRESLFAAIETNGSILDAGSSYTTKDGFHFVVDDNSKVIYQNGWMTMDENSTFHYVDNKMGEVLETYEQEMMSGFTRNEAVDFTGIAMSGRV